MVIKQTTKTRFLQGAGCSNVVLVSNRVHGCMASARLGGLDVHPPDPTAVTEML